MKNALNVYRKYRAAKSKSKLYRTVHYLVWSLTAAFLLLLSYPQILFAHEVSYKNFTVYSREPLDKDVYTLLDKVEFKLSHSPLNTPEVKPKIFFTNSQKLYSIVSLYIGSNSFGKGFAALPTSNVFINKADLGQDLVFRDAPTNNKRSLSGVVSHEITHLLIRKRFGYLKNLTLPVWKREGYCEYVAGGSTLDYETGVKLWKANPKDSTGYQYFKYYMLVKYLLEHERLSVEELFTNDIDREAIEAKVLSSL